jgi:hypothetical protein
MNKYLEKISAAKYPKGQQTDWSKYDEPALNRVGYHPHSPESPRIIPEAALKEHVPGYKKPEFKPGKGIIGKAVSLAKKHPVLTAGLALGGAAAIHKSRKDKSEEQNYYGYQ